MVDVRAEHLTGNNIYMDVVSVGATVNIMLAAVKAKGLTVIENAAKEPHIVDLANFLNSMGADIRGAGTDVIKIFGVDYLRGTTYSIIPDQIEAGTMVAVAATGGDVMIKNVIPKHLESISAKLIEMGVSIEEYDDSLHVKERESCINATSRPCLILGSQPICSRKLLCYCRLLRVPVLLMRACGTIGSAMWKNYAVWVLSSQ